MNREMTTTPFGRRPMSYAMLDAQTEVKNCDVNVVADKWKLFRMITEARPLLGISDRALAVLHALLSFHKPNELDSTANISSFFRQIGNYPCVATGWHQLRCAGILPPWWRPE